VLIANRGEIAIRIARTCRRLNIKTVAVYTYNDTKSIHIKECDESYCIGDSYLNIDQLKNAIQVTKSDAVHPGYGFLSENADFSLSIQEMDLPVEEEGIAWLGPPASAIRDMGCKVRSKEIAKDAGINIIPGIEGELQSIENALEIMSSNNNNDLEYPILLKAAAGGGGKGMRICSNDQELIEFYPLAQSEGLKYFKDDRLLIEKYISNPHHIEFQVICSPSKKKKDNANTNANTNANANTNTNTNNGSIDVAIFPERECSIQRRNQKVIEESPSYNLLTEETRHTMMIQTAKLCQQVQYIGAGTIEWLVESDNNIDNNNGNNDGQNENQKKQKFHFLEMNTRLQVEHPITESITNTDLVDAMLRVGSGNGLPLDWYNVATTINDNDNDGNILVIPWKGHAIEARIYAEDPLRGYLPSTGPLVPYKEPYGAITVLGKKKEIIPSPSSSNSDLSSTSYLRLDSGVAEGHVVTPFYDPMLSKIISYAQTRDEAIKVLSDGLDAYVIEGVRHNARLVNAVLRHPEFRHGHTPTSFLDNHIPEFNGVQLTNREEEELAVAVAIISKSRESFLGRPTTPTTNTNTKVVIDSLNLDLENYLAEVSLDGNNRTIQVLKAEHSGELKIQMYGADMQCIVQSPREYELSKHMRPPVIEDTSDLVMSPMPGTLINFSIQVGDHVEAGQELCVVEAMKMQNIIRSPRKGNIVKLYVEKGAALVTDEVIMEFGNNTEEEESSVA
ncbi:Biotin_carb_C-domain-containing protein, partial [Fragilariopsis cylindrus CCMP1102]